MLGTGQINEKDIKIVGSISNDLEKLILDERGHMSAKFNNSVGFRFFIRVFFNMQESKSMQKAY